MKKILLLLTFTLTSNLTYCLPQGYGEIVSRNMEEDKPLRALLLTNSAHNIYKAVDDIRDEEGPYIGAAVCHSSLAICSTIGALAYPENGNWAGYSYLTSRSSNMPALLCAITLIGCADAINNHFFIPYYENAVRGFVCKEALGWSGLHLIKGALGIIN